MLFTVGKSKHLQLAQFSLVEFVHVQVCIGHDQQGRAGYIKYVLDV